jgi:hypothetical protein
MLLIMAVIILLAWYLGTVHRVNTLSDALGETHLAVEPRVSLLNNDGMGVPERLRG